MNFGIPLEQRPFEFRVGLTPPAVRSLVRAGHKVYFEHNAGLKAGFTDEAYEKAGGNLVYTPDEAYGRADVVVKIARPTEAEYTFFENGQTLISYLHLAVASDDLLKQFAQREMTTIGSDTIETDDGRLPVLQGTSEIAGRMAPIIAGDLLGSFKGGRGILLSGIPGIAPASVVVIGAGTLGFNAARAFRGIGAEVTMLDSNLNILRDIDVMFNNDMPTLFSNQHNLEKTTLFADVLVTAAAKPGGRAPHLISREMLKSMKPRSVLLDFAINSGGNVETSRPTTLANPSYIEENVIHYCVPNVPSRVARTGSYAFSNDILRYLKEIGEVGVEKAIKQNTELRRGVNTFNGQLAHTGVAESLKTSVEVKL